MKDRLLQILADTLGVPVSQIPPDASMDKLPQWDSIAHLNIIMTLEQEFHIEFTAEELIALNSLPAIEQALSARGIA